MKTVLIIAVAILLISTNLKGQTFRKIDEQGLLELTGKQNDTTYVINFWATWCSPCLKEIGYFEQLYRDSKDRRIGVILVSLDFPSQAEKTVLPFLKDKGITAPVALMTDPGNSYIQKQKKSVPGKGTNFSGIA